MFGCLFYFWPLRQIRISFLSKVRKKVERSCLSECAKKFLLRAEQMVTQLLIFEFFWWTQSLNSEFFFLRFQILNFLEGIKKNLKKLKKWKNLNAWLVKNSQQDRVSWKSKDPIFFWLLLVFILNFWSIFKKRTKAKKKEHKENAVPLLTKSC